MKKKGYILAGLFIALLFLFASGPKSSSAADYSQCRNCHPQLDFGAPILNRLTVCANCHNNGAHATNSIYTSYGYFLKSNFTDPTKTQAQVITGFSGAFLHGKHGGSAQTSSYCIGCHGRLSCKVCHTSVGDPPILKHEPHSTTVYPAASLNMALGPGRGDRFPVIQSTCVTSKCHNLYPNVTKTRSDGSQLCLNCHSTDGRGHYDQAGLDTKHSSSVTTLKLGSVDYVVSCEGCHATSLSGEHRNVAKKLNLPQNGDCYYCHGQSVQATVAGAVTQIKTNNKATTDLTVKAANRSCTVCHFNIAVLPGNPAEHVTYHLSGLSDTFVDIAKNIHKDCNTCHDNASVASFVYGKAQLPIAERNYGCLDCHNTANNLAPKHKALLDGQEMEVTELHPGCTTCHTPNTDFAAKVSTIAANLKNGATSYDCTECHTGATLDEGHTGTIDEKCQTCHKNTLTTEHLDNPVTQAQNAGNPLTCSTCHKSEKAEVRLAITVGNTNCFACHNQAHNFSMTQPVPTDIPLYPGYEWSTPQPADVWANETWMPVGYEGAKLLISNRRTDVTGAAIWAYYKENMATNGWTAPATDPSTSTNFFSAEFTKGKNKVTIFFYGGENHTATPVVPTGYRLEILYR